MPVDLPEPPALPDDDPGWSEPPAGAELPRLEDVAGEPPPPAAVRVAELVARIEGEKAAMAAELAATAKAEEKKAEEKKKAWPLSRLTQGELTEKPPPRRWLLMQENGPNSKGLFPLGKVGLLAAPGGTGKSMALCSLALAVATGRAWLQAGMAPVGAPGGFGVATSGRVALLLAEEDREEVIRRLYHAARLMNLGPEEQAAVLDRLWIGALAGEPVELTARDDNRNVEEHPRAEWLREKLTEVVLEAVLRQRDAAERAVLRQRAEALAAELTEADTGGEGWALVIVDPLSRFGGVDTETDNGAATRAIQALEALAKLPGGPAVMVAAHERKGGAGQSLGQDAVRGSSAIVDGARWVARLEPELVPADADAYGKRQAERWTTPGGDLAVRLRLVKTNYGPPMERAGRLLVLDGEHHGALRVATKGELGARALVNADEAAAKAAKKEEAEAAKAARAQAADEKKAAAAARLKAWEEGGGQPGSKPPTNWEPPAWKPQRQAP